MQLNEGETPADGGVHHGDRPVRGVHGADDVQVVRERERLVGAVLQVDAVVAVLQQEVQLTEHLGQVGAVHLIDDQEVGLVFVAGLGRFFGKAAQRAGDELEGHLSFVGLVRPEALEEVLVGVRGVELHQLDAFIGAVPGKLGGQVLGQVGLARSGRAVENQLPVLLQEFRDFLQRFQVHVQGRRELLRQGAEPLRNGFDDGGRLGGVVGLRFRFGRQ
ncbi:hypothetical protein D9M72_290120 [compost metagenome]